MVPEDGREKRVQDFVKPVALEGPGVRDFGADPRGCRRWSTPSGEYVAEHHREEKLPDPRFDTSPPEGSATWLACS